MEKERKVKIKNKLYFIVTAIFIIIALLIPFVFAAIPVQQPTTENEIFSVDDLKKAPGSTLEMTLNLDCIQYENFAFTLSLINETSDVNTSDITTDSINENDDNKELDAEIEYNDKNIVISGNKSTMNMSEIKLYYKIPEDIEIGTTITFKAEIENTSEKDAQDNTQVNETSNEIVDNNEVVDTDSSGENNLGEEDPNEQTSQEQQISQKETIEVTITIVEEESDSDNNNNEQGTFGDNNQSLNNGQNQTQSNGQSQNNQVTSMQTSSSSIKNVSSAQTETVTYNGSNNNYLESLQLEGYTLNKEFSKENTTYFIKIEDEEIDSIEVTAEAEDKETTVCIYGNEDITEGSKILISVTAENGNVRVYRIFVQK